MSDFGRIDQVLRTAIQDGAFPGCAYAIGRRETLHANALGHHTYEPGATSATLDTIWDLASVSKVVATTTLFMLLVDRGQVDVEQPVGEFLPEFATHGKESLTFGNMLRHDSGLIAYRRFQLTCDTSNQVWDAICSEELEYETGSKMVYSDLSMIVVAKAIERKLGVRLDAAFETFVAVPLGLSSTLFDPMGRPRYDALNFAPTEAFEDWRRRLRAMRGRPGVDDPYTVGEVHDPTAAVMDGIAGHAGLFSTVWDLAKFARIILRGGGELISPETVRRFTSKQSGLSTRGLGWDTKSPEGSSAGVRFGPRSFGHTGYTGTSLWIDLDAEIFAILLTNRVHPTSENLKIAQVRPRFHDAVFEALFPA